MNAPAVVTIDFESVPIKRRPEYPPKPTGVSIQWPEWKKPRYWSFAHPTKNNSTLTEARHELQKAWQSKLGLLFQNGKFDVDVAETHMQCKPLPWERIHDTMFLLFLHDPYANLSLKPSAERVLGMKPEERDIVVDWLKKNLPFERERDHTGEYLKWEAYIGYAPGDIVGDYASGDVTRTLKLFRKLYPYVHAHDMLDAYDRDRRLMPILLRNEREGIRTDFTALIRENKLHHSSREIAALWLRKALKTPDLNLNAKQDVAAAFDRAGWVDPDKWVVTDAGNRSVSKKNLTPSMVNSARGASVYGFWSKMNTCVQTEDGWIRQATETKLHTIHTNWSQVRQQGGGASTGRIQSSPNFQNIAKDLEAKDDGYIHPAFLKDIVQLPLLRKYLLPDVGHVWGHRDYSQQELRILGHFEEGGLMEAYIADPTLDVHGIVDRAIQTILNLFFPRTKVKNVVFQKVYGGGIPAICAALGCDAVTAKKVIAAMMEALPGYATLEKDVKAVGKAGDPIVTWGGREYFVRPPSYSKRFKRHMTYEYMLLNYLIQGSAGDCTKEAIIRYDAHPKRQARFLVTVHDEINSSSPAKRIKEEMLILKECMQSVDFRVPMLSEAKVGPRWSELKKIAA